MKTSDWLEQHRFVTLSLVLLIIFLSIISLLFIKANEITKDPCSICAKKHGNNVYCTLQGGMPITKTYLTNGSSYDNSEEVREIVEEIVDKQQEKMYENINFSGLIKSNDS